jgi:hypothetical protein
MQVADPGEVLDHRWRHPAAHGAGDDRVAEFEAEELGWVDSGIDAGEDVHLLVREERIAGTRSLAPVVAKLALFRRSSSKLDMT